MTRYMDYVDQGILDAIKYRLPKLGIRSDWSQGDIERALKDCLDDSEPCSVDYFSEALDIISDPEFGPDERPDFTSCEDASDCVFLEARQAVWEAHWQRLGSVVRDVAEEIASVCECALDLGYDGEMEISDSYIHGWAVHNRETSDGIAIYDDKPGYYNPELLEGEFYAVEKQISCGKCISACWDPTKVEAA